MSKQYQVTLTDMMSKYKPVSCIITTDLTLEDNKKNYTFGYFNKQYIKFTSHYGKEKTIINRKRTDTYRYFR